MVVTTNKSPVLKALPKQTIVVAGFDKGQITEFENDKIPFSACSVLQNMVLRKKNLETRRGYNTIKEDEDINGLCTLNSSSVPILGVFKKGTTTTSLSSLNPVTGALTELIASAAGTQAPSWDNSNDVFFFTTGGGVINSYDVDTSTAATPLTLAGIKDLAVSDKRVWGMTSSELHYSTVARDSFSDSLGTYDATTGIWTKGLTHGGKVSLGSMSNLVTVVADGRDVVVFSKDRLQCHKLVNPEGLTYFDPNAITMQYERSYGVESPRAVMVHSGYIYFANKDGFYRLNPRTGDVKRLTKNKTQHQSLGFNKAALGYDKELSAVLVSCQKNAANDTVLAYFEEYEAFAYFTNISANEWVSLEDKLYAYNRAGTKVMDMFPDNTWTDDGVPINYRAVTAAIDMGKPQYYKKMSEIFTDVANEGTNTIYTDLFFDRLSGGTKPATSTFPITWENAPMTFATLAGHPIGDAPLGMSSIDNVGSIREKEERFKNRTKFGRVEIQLRGSTIKRISWRRFVLEYQNLPKKIKSMTIAS